MRQVGGDTDGPGESWFLGISRKWWQQNLVVTWMRERGVRQDPWGNGDDHRGGCLENLSLKHKQTAGVFRHPVFRHPVFRGTTLGRETNFCVISQSVEVLKSPKCMRTPNEVYSVDKVTKKPRAVRAQGSPARQGWWGDQ